MTEATLERACLDLLARLGFSTYRLSQGYRKAKGGTRQTPGLGDIFAIHPAKRVTLWMEVKPPEEVARLARLLARSSVPPSALKDWKRARAQAAFGQQCRAAGQPYCYGGMPELVECLRSLGFRLGDLRNV